MTPALLAVEMISWTPAIKENLNIRALRPDRALSGLWGGGKTRRPDIFHAGFDE
jgi:hypothetical protein